MSTTSSVDLGQEYDNKEFDFSLLPDDVCDIEDRRDYEKMNDKYERRIQEATTSLDGIQPNMKALEKYDEIVARISAEEQQLDEVKKQSILAARKFEDVKQARYQRFMEAFEYVSSHIDEIYKKLTYSSKHPLGGTAYLTLGRAKSHTTLALSSMQCLR